MDIHSLLFVFLLMPLAFAKSLSTSLTCGNNSFFIQYPFHLLQDNQKPPKKNLHRELNLRCNDQGVVVINLDPSGDFFVHDINYFDQKIRLYDPGTCLPGRLMNLSLSSISRLVPILDQNYTFLNCPSEEVGARVTSISCLSNSTNFVVATTSIPHAEEMKLSGCNAFLTRPIPVSSLDESENNLFVGDLELTWNVTLKTDSRGRSQGKILVRITFIMLISFAAILALLFCIGGCLFLIRIHLDNHETDATSHNYNYSINEERSQIVLPVERPQVEDVNGSLTGLSTGVSVIGESQRITGPNSDSCPICLEEYIPRQKIRHVQHCQHCFHASCLDTWLRMGKTTCPVCRVSVL